MARQQPESRLVNKIKLRLETNFPGSFWIKIHGGSYQQAGIPDLIGCVEGVFFGLEVKLPDKLDTLTGLQQYTLDLITKAEGVAVVVTDPKEAEAIVRKAMGYEEASN